LAFVVIDHLKEGAGKIGAGAGLGG